jgi:hypothetical protein
MTIFGDRHEMEGLYTKAKVLSWMRRTIKHSHT